MSEAAERKIAELEKELRGTQEMLAFVLKAVGHEVVVPKEILETGLPEGTQIKVDDDIVKQQFVFSLEVPDA